jgi:hypothetical protein
MNELVARSQAKKQRLSKAELADASDQVRANLVITLQKLTAKLASEEAGSINMSHFKGLVEAASRLFAWPAPKAIEVSNPEDSAKQLHAAINLALIRTTPEQLRAKARQITLNDVGDVAKLAS